MDIIVAEDHPVSAKLLEKILTRAGHTPLLAADGERAWELLRRHQARMLLTDWMMPGLDGLGLCKRIRELPPTPYTYIILLTARDATADILCGFEAGADDYIAKPVNPDELMARIRVGLRHLALEDRHEKTLRQLMHTEKLASLGQLAAGMAHEINNPLGFLTSNIKTFGTYTQEMQAFIQSCIHLLPQLRKLENPPQELREKIKDLEKYQDLAYILEDLDQLVAESREGLGRIGKIVEDMRIFAQPAALNPELTDIHHCITLSLSMLTARLGSAIELVQDLGDLPRIFCFPNQLQQAFCNIFLNAIQAMEGNGKLYIQTRKEKDQIRIRIQDTGTGIAPEILPRIFDPFFTTRPVGQGTGLGLHVAYTLIQRHGGSIEASSPPHAGATFDILLPIAGV
jgi:signal transduction histidine kinase